MEEFIDQLLKAGYLLKKTKTINSKTIKKINTKFGIKDSQQS